MKGTMNKPLRQVTIYQLNFDYHDPRIVKRTFTLDPSDKIKDGANGSVEVTLVDAQQSGHNGDWYDDHEYGFQTFKHAKASLIRRVKSDFKKEMDHIKSLKEAVE
jgi:hypothetical protein